jgi:hypothetical protein
MRLASQRAGEQRAMVPHSFFRLAIHDNHGRKIRFVDQEASRQSLRDKGCSLGDSPRFAENFAGLVQGALYQPEFFEGQRHVAAPRRAFSRQSIQGDQAGGDLNALASNRIRERRPVLVDSVRASRFIALRH